MAAFAVIARYWLVTDIYKSPGPGILEALSGARNFNRWMADTIRPYAGRRVLEIGAGIGNLTRHLAPGRERYIATDLDEEHLARLRVQLQHRPNLEIRRCNLADAADFEPLRGSADSVICLNVLEHIADDLAGLRHIHSALEAGGRAVILVPQDQGLFGTLDDALGHHRRYSGPELRARMEEAGFQVERLFEFNRITRPGWYVQGRVLRRQAISPLPLRLFDSLVWLWRRVDGMLPWAGASVVGVGVKQN